MKKEPKLAVAQRHFRALPFIYSQLPPPFTFRSIADPECEFHKWKRRSGSAGGSAGGPTLTPQLPPNLVDDTNFYYSQQISDDSLYSQICYFRSLAPHSDLLFDQLGRKFCRDATFYNAKIKPLYPPKNLSELNLLLATLDSVIRDELKFACLVYYILLDFGNNNGKYKENAASVYSNSRLESEFIRKKRNLNVQKSKIRLSYGARIPKAHQELIRAFYLLDRFDSVPAIRYLCNPNIRPEPDLLEFVLLLLSVAQLYTISGNLTIKGNGAEGFTSVAESVYFLIRSKCLALNTESIVQAYVDNLVDCGFTVEALEFIKSLAVEEGAKLSENGNVAQSVAQNKFRNRLYKIVRRSIENEVRIAVSDVNNTTTNFKTVSGKTFAEICAVPFATKWKFRQNCISLISVQHRLLPEQELRNIFVDIINDTSDTEVIRICRDLLLVRSLHSRVIKAEDVREFLSTDSGGTEKIAGETDVFTGQKPENCASAGNQKRKAGSVIGAAYKKRKLTRRIELSDVVAWMEKSESY